MTSTADKIHKQHMDVRHDAAHKAGEDVGYRKAILDLTERATAVSAAEKRDLARRYSVSPYTDLDGLILEVLARWGKK